MLKAILYSLPLIQYIVFYSERIAASQSMPIHQEIKRQDIITYNDMEMMIEKEKQTPQEKKAIEDLKNKS